ncbi:hypothetical protein [Aurantiacibacter hainanensis]|uniref:hypothetical protein n=1 Tax=Aurantiacibacter hainanensis TaxID=3076114 RepID=UPI0030C6A39C
MTTICPIGTCRIHTPLKRARNTHMVALEKSRNYGFTHTANEALQQLRFMHGKIDIPERVRSLVFRHGIETQLKSALASQPDHYLVEVSSAKRITVDGTAVQINYLYRRFEDLFSEVERRNRFSELAERSSPKALHEWLEAQPQFTRLPEAEQELVKDVRIVMDTKDDIKSALSDIVDLVGREKLVVTTHVDALDENGKRLPKRHRNITDVETACEELDIVCYNPTGLMQRIEQEDALKSEGRDLTHFTDTFSDALFRDWNAHYYGISPRADNDDEDIAGFSQSRYNRDLEEGRVFRASRSLRNAARHYPQNLGLQLERARLDYRLGSYELALAFFEERGKECNLSDGDQEAWLVSLYEVGDPQEALEFGETLLADEIESPLIYATVARAAADVGQTETAITRWKHLFFRGEAALEAASEVLDLLDRGPKAAEKKDEWVALVLERYPQHEDALAVLWKAAIEKRSADRLLYLLRQSRHMSDELALDLAAKCCAADLHAIGAQLLVFREEPAPENFVEEEAAAVRQWIDNRRSRWLKEGQESLDAGDLFNAAQRLNAAFLVEDRRARQPRRELDRILLHQAREAYKESDYEALLETYRIARSALVEFRQMHLLVGRTHYALENHDAAVDHLLQEIAQQDFDSRLAWNVARAAIYAERYGVAIDQLLLIAADEESSDKEREDARGKLNSLVGKAVRQARELTAEGRFDDARDLLEKMAKIDGARERADQELYKLASALKKQIRVLDASQYEKQLELGRRLFEIDPENEFGAKHAAMGAMKAGRFETAIHYFEAMRPLTARKSQVDRNIAKCQAKLARKAA